MSRTNSTIKFLSICSIVFTSCTAACFGQLAFADIDNDGDMDFAAGVKRSRNWLVSNDYAGDTRATTETMIPSG